MIPLPKISLGVGGNKYESILYRYVMNDGGHIGMNMTKPLGRVWNHLEGQRKVKQCTSHELYLLLCCWIWSICMQAVQGLSNIKGSTRA